MTLVLFAARYLTYWLRAQAFEAAKTFVWFTVLPFSSICTHLRREEKEFDWRITIHQYHYLFLVGLAKISIALGLAFGLATIWHPAVAGLVGAIFFIIASGGIHLDGLADTVDAMFAFGKDKYEVMREPQIGAIGAAYMNLYLWLFIPILAYNLYWLLSQTTTPWFEIVLLAHVAMMPKINCYAVLCLAEAKEPLRRDKHMELDSTYPFWNGPLTSPGAFLWILALAFIGELALFHADLRYVALASVLFVLALAFNFHTLPKIKKNLGFLNGDVFGTMICILDLAGQFAFALIFVRHLQG